MKKTLVMKFGGASVASPDHFANLVDIILDRKKEFYNIVVVVSAMGDTTDHLISLANQVHPNPPRREYDMLISVGERVSISLLAMALAKRNVEAISFTGSQSGIITCNRHSDAKIVDVKPKRLIPHLEKGSIVIVAGFQGVSREGEITTLGRGGSDTTAVALGIALKASKVEFFKDVQGIYTTDPKIDSSATLYSMLTYAEAKDVIAKHPQILHSRCLSLAEKNNLQLHITSFQKSNNGINAGTLISGSETSVSQPIYEEE